MRWREIRATSRLCAVGLVGLGVVSCGTDANGNTQSSSPSEATEAQELANSDTVAPVATNDRGQECRGGVSRSYAVHSSLDEAAKASDIVIAGSVVAAEPDIRFPTSRHDGYTVYDVEVEDVFQGDTGGQDEIKAVIATHSAGCLLPEDNAGPYPELGDRGIWMLNETEPEDGYPQLYMLSHVQALINQPTNEATRSGEQLEIFGDGSEPITAEVGELGTLGNIMDELRSE